MNNSCHSCFSDRRDLVALHHSSISWRPGFQQTVVEECLSAIGISWWSGSWALVETVETTDGGGLEIQMGTCSSVRDISSASFYISANGYVINTVLCAPQISCDVDSSGSSRRLGDTSGSLPRIELLILQWRPEIAMAALSVLDLLISVESATFAIHDMWNNTLEVTSAESQEAVATVQAFFNLRLSESSESSASWEPFGCVAASAARASVEVQDVQDVQESELLLLVGSLCSTDATRKETALDTSFS